MSADAAGRRPARSIGRDAWLAPGRGLTLTGLSLVSGVMACLVAVAGCLLVVGVGVYLLPASVAMLRGVADLARGAVRRWSGVSIDSPYRPEPDLTTEFAGRLDRSRALLSETATWRDLLWSCVDWLIGGLLGLVPASLILYGVFGAAVQPFVWSLIEGAGGSNWYTAIHVSSTATAVLSIPVGIGLIVLGLAVGPRVLLLHGRWSAVLLSPTRTALLKRRVDRLTGTRTDATDAQAAELRRIERDLHDGAQARLVAMGMTLSRAERLLDDDPTAARNLVVAARETSSRALEELRDLVRGIHPPVLADRGLTDAVLALSLDSALDVTVASQLDARLVPSIESAVYFAVSELVTNAAKHGARGAQVMIEHQGGLLSAAVVDDGPGGADPGRGSGLRGVARRLAAFDGTMEITSPAGGPTTVLLEVPCVLSSPKTSSC